MRYRSLNTALVEEIATALVVGEEPAIESRAEDAGEGVSLDEQPLREILEEFREELRNSEPADTEVFEGRLAAAIYPWLSSLPIEVLDDRGFWRYLSVRHFWWFIAWREAKPISRGNFLNLVDSRTPAEQIPLRLFLRAKSIDTPTSNGSVDLAGEIPESTDFWRSHIVRVRVGTAPHLARAFAETKRDEAQLITPLTASRVREVAKRVNRTWSNVRLDLYDTDEAREFIRSQVEAEL